MIRLFRKGLQRRLDKGEMGGDFVYSLKQTASKLITMLFNHVGKIHHQRTERVKEIGLAYPDIQGQTVHARGEREIHSSSKNINHRLICSKYFSEKFL